MGYRFHYDRKGNYKGYSSDTPPRPSGTDWNFWMWLIGLPIVIYWVFTSIPELLQAILDILLSPFRGW